MLRRSDNIKRYFMLFLFALAIALTVAFLLDKPLKKHPAVFYITAAVLTAATIVIKRSDVSISNEFVRDYLLAMFTRGALGGAFWAVVMWAGALPNGSAPIKKLMPIRGELSITAAILTLSHVITYGIQYISDIIRDRTGSGDAFRDFVITSIVCLIMVLIMIPLTVMSFKTIRRNMNARTWKKIQRTAYIFYALIFVHIIVLFVPKAQNGRDGYFLSVLVYSAVFIGYAAMRIRKAFVIKKKPATKTAPNIVCACAMIVPLCLIGFVSRSTNDKETIKATKDAPAQFVFEAPSEAASSTTAVSAVTTLASGTSTTTLTETVTSTAESTASETTLTATTSAESTKEEVSTEADSAAAVTEENEPVTQAAEPVTEKTVTNIVTEAVASEAPVVTAAVTTKQQAQEPTTAEQPVYRFKNGTFDGEGEGYAGTVHVSITIENDYITGFSAYADEDDPDYFSDAMQSVIPQIQRSMSADVDACSGATYSSKGIMEAARNALNKAKN